MDALLAAQDARIAVLENKLAHFSRVGNDITITGANLHVVSGSAVASGAINGLGNVIIGYNELRGAGDVRTGSHNLVVGEQHNFSAYGGIVVGFRNSITGNYASISGGAYGVASGTSASISGGGWNTASSSRSSVSGGNTRSAPLADNWAAGGLFQDF